jgi:hypothetical protein
MLTGNWSFALLYRLSRYNNEIRSLLLIVARLSKLSINAKTSMIRNRFGSPAFLWSACANGVVWKLTINDEYIGCLHSTEVKYPSTLGSLLTSVNANRRPLGSDGGTVFDTLRTGLYSWRETHNSSINFLVQLFTRSKLHASLFVAFATCAKWFWFISPCFAISGWLHCGQTHSHWRPFFASWMWIKKLSRVCSA